MKHQIEVNGIKLYAGSYTRNPATDNSGNMSTVSIKVIWIVVFSSTIFTKITASITTINEIPATDIINKTIANRRSNKRKFEALFRCYPRNCRIEKCSFSRCF